MLKQKCFGLRTKMRRVEEHSDAHAAASAHCLGFSRSERGHPVELPLRWYVLSTNEWLGLRLSPRTQSKFALENRDTQTCCLQFLITSSEELSEFEFGGHDVS